MDLVFTVQRDSQTGVFIASWDDPQGGGITTQAESWKELFDLLVDAVRCHFVGREAPRTATVRFEQELQLA